MKISAVSYLNTLPFIYGLQHSSIINQIDLSIDYPSECARKLVNNEVDIGLIPIAVLPKNPNYNIISDYCIGADGKVDSVFLFSDVEINEIEKIYLDYQSRTSINLMKILAEKHWKIQVEWLSAKVGYEAKISQKTAGVVIGDRTFALKQNFKYAYDLAEEWKKMTNLPFVFATWTANKNIEQQFVNQFNKALKFGLENIDNVLKFYKNKIFEVSKHADIKRYLTQNISYNFTKKKQEALKSFLLKKNSLFCF